MSKQWTTMWTFLVVSVAVFMASLDHSATCFIKAALEGKRDRTGSRIDRDLRSGTEGGSKWSRT